MREPRVHHARKAVQLVAGRDLQRGQGRLDGDDGAREVERRVLEVDDLAAAEQATPLARALVDVGRAVLEDEAVRDGDPDARLAHVGLGHEPRQDDAQHGLERPLLGLVGAVGRPADLAARDAELRDGVAEHGEVAGRQLGDLGRPARARAVEDGRQQHGARRREGLLVGQEVQARHRLVEAQPELLDRVPVPDDPATATGAGADIADRGRAGLLQGRGRHPQRAQRVVLRSICFVFFHLLQPIRRIVLDHLKPPHQRPVDLGLGRIQDAQVDGQTGGIGPGDEDARDA
ncbi:hypothetical protein PG990_004238 [Apiospora arundinis]